MKISRFPRIKMLLFVIFLVISTIATFAQDPKPKSAFWSQVRFGGGLGLGFTNGGFNAAVSPSAIYQVNDQFAAGLSLNFNYAKFNDDKLLAFGGSVLTLYNPIRYIQLSAELEQLRINRSFDDGTIRLENDYWSPALFLGVGYTNNFMTIGIRYNVLHDDNESIYANDWMPFVRVYF